MAKGDITWVERDGLWDMHVEGANPFDLWVIRLRPWRGGWRCVEVPESYPLEEAKAMAVVAYRMQGG